ncbi:MAG: glycosyltransferase [Candidatus Omnitrophota bacterium]|jgi:spore maturation protein CgeB
MNKKRIVLMASEALIAPFEKEGCEVFWTLPLVYSLFYEGKDRVVSKTEEFTERLCSYRDKIFQFKPIYFFAEQWFFINLLSRLEPASRRKIASLWMDFINDLKKEGIVTIIFCQDDPLPFSYFRKQDLTSLTYSFHMVATHSLQMKALYKSHGQRIIYFPSFANFDFLNKTQHQEHEKVEPSILKFDLFFIGSMDRQRKIFFRLLSKKVKDLDYFFGCDKFYYTSRKNIDFDIGNQYYLEQIYEKTSINVVYGSCADSVFRKTWGVSNRILNIAYSHGFFLCDYRKHLVDLFDIDTRLYSFGSIHECHRKIRFYLERAQLRKELADKFHNQVMINYTANKVIEKLICDIEKNY